MLLCSARMYSGAQKFRTPPKKIDKLYIEKFTYSDFFYISIPERCELSANLTNESWILVDSMPVRINAIISSKGKHTKY